MDLRVRDVSHSNSLLCSLQIAVIILQKSVRFVYMILATLLHYL